MKSIRIFRDYRGKWVVLIRPHLERWIPRWIGTDVARIGADTQWVRLR